MEKQIEFNFPPTDPDELADKIQKELVAQGKKGHESVYSFVKEYFRCNCLEKEIAGSFYWNVVLKIEEINLRNKENTFGHSIINTGRPPKTEPNKSDQSPKPHSSGNPFSGPDAYKKWEDVQDEKRE